MPGYNDFATKYPQLAEEWDSDKNGELKPNMILCNYIKLVYWKCKSCGQSYEALTHNRIRGDACPYCSGHQVLKGVNDFATIHPELLSEWDYEHNSSPDQFTVGSSERVSWICSICGHKWKTNIVKRSNGAQCPKCNKRNHTSFPEQAIFYYIRQVFPDAQNGYTEFFLDSMELDIYIPSLSVGIEYDGIQWHTEKTEEREKKKYEICKRNKVTLIRVEEFKEDNQYCDIAIECSYRGRDYTALDSVINKIFEILKISGPIVDTEMDTVFINEQFLVEKKEGSFGALFPQYCEEWNYEKNGALSPMMFAPYSNEIVWWKCKVCGAEYRKAISGRARGIGCRNCSYKLRGQKLGERMRKRVRNVETGEIFQSLAETAEKYGESSKNNHIGECCRGQRKTAYGYHWEYAINKE